MSIVLIGCDHGGQIHITDDDIGDGDEQALAEIAAEQEAEYEGNGIRMFDGVEEHCEMEDGMGMG